MRICQYPHCQEEDFLSADNKDFCGTHYEQVKLAATALKNIVKVERLKKLVTLK